MSCKIYMFPSFEREAKRQNKRYKSLKSDLKELTDLLKRMACFDMLFKKGVKYEGKEIKNIHSSY